MSEHPSGGQMIREAKPCEQGATQLIRRANIADAHKSAVILAIYPYPNGYIVATIPAMMSEVLIERMSTELRAARFLITGSRGFLGSHVAEVLGKRHPKSKLFLLSHRRAPGSIACNLEDVGKTVRILRRIKPTHIIHVAGRAGGASPKELRKAHIDATRGLLEAVRTLPNSKNIRIVIAGSSGEYGACRSRGPLIESDPLNPVTPYGESKRDQYLLAASYSRRGLCIVWARVFNVVGPGIPENLALGSFAKQIARIERRLQDRIRVGSLAAKRDYIDVRDVARALDLLGQRGVLGESYNVCSSRSSSMGELLRSMIALARRPIPVDREASRFRPGEIRNVYGSYRKLAALGWKPRYKLRDSIRNTLQWHRARVREGTAATSGS